MLFLCVLSVQNIYAWLNDGTSEVSNSFNPNNIQIDICETDTDDGDSDKYTNTYEMIPDEDISKDPTIEVPKDTLDAWIFVQLEELDNFAFYMTYEIDDEWNTLGKDYPGVFYMPLASSSENQSIPVLKDNLVRLNEGIGKDEINAMTDKPKLRITAYGIQQAGFPSPEDAWKELNGK